VVGVVLQKSFIVASLAQSISAGLFDPLQAPDVLSRSPGSAPTISDYEHPLRVPVLLPNRLAHRTCNADKPYDGRTVAYKDSHNSRVQGERTCKSRPSPQPRSQLPRNPVEPERPRRYAQSSGHRDMPLLGRVNTIPAKIAENGNHLGAVRAHQG